MCKIFLYSVAVAVEACGALTSAIIFLFWHVVGAPWCLLAVAEAPNRAGWFTLSLVGRVK